MTSPGQSVPENSVSREVADRIGLISIEPEPRRRSTSGWVLGAPKYLLNSRCGPVALADANSPEWAGAWPGTTQAAQLVTILTLPPPLGWCQVPSGDPHPPPGVCGALLCFVLFYIAELQLSCGGRRITKD